MMLNPVETPWLAVGIAFAVWVIIVSRSVFGGMEKRWWHYVVVLAIVAAGIGVDYLLDSDMEAINKQLEAGRTAVIESRPGDIADLLARDYSDAVHGSKAEFMARCRSVLDRRAVEDIDFGKKVIELDGRHATVELGVFGKPAKGTGYADIAPVFRVEMELELAKNGGEWLIERAELVKVNGQSVSWTRLR
ncbi:hypothetical protein STSP2_02735 [Anaerohalosphaera lusitana]|uniref:SnoaL-like domain-containing protein n=1 Tax=Anaerohalosphaera lusitana TaxID=1936003 RepID=A0A1U9NNQ9_9BACT|nr:hypothetical protein [Anaerohalosphaera lusitana]AQT69543.1 hypothetical protein STSP2_02735 [Anaerohalosphaera lusitana]